MFLFQKSLDDRECQERKDKLSYIGTMNDQHCQACPKYGYDLCQCVLVCKDYKDTRWIGALTHQKQRMSDALTCLVRTPQDLVVEMKEILKR